MRVTYEFEDQEYERKLFEGGPDFYQTLSEIQEMIRSYHKYESCDSSELVEKISSVISDCPWLAIQ